MGNSESMRHGCIHEPADTCYSTSYKATREAEPEPEPVAEAAPEPVAEPDGYGSYAP
jgi:hypothetical protein